MAIAFYIPDQSQLIAAYANSNSNSNNNNSSNNNSNNVYNNNSSIVSNNNNNNSNNSGNNNSTNNNETNNENIVCNNSPNNNNNNNSNNNDINNNNAGNCINNNQNLNNNALNANNHNNNNCFCQESTRCQHHHQQRPAAPTPTSNAHANANNFGRFWRRISIPVNIRATNDVNNNNNNHCNYNYPNGLENCASGCWGICVQGFWYALSCCSPNVLDNAQHESDVDESRSETSSSSSSVSEQANTVVSPETSEPTTAFEIVLEVDNPTTAVVTIAAATNSSGIRISVEFDECRNGYINYGHNHNHAGNNGIRSQPSNIFKGN